jgi:hypothetical protein
VNSSITYGFIHDHIATAKRGATAEEIMLRLKELNATYLFNAHFGFSYAIGSLASPINPRFGQGNMVATGFF